MSQQRDIERLLDAWFDDGRTFAPERVLDVVVDRIERQRQRPVWRLDWRRHTMNPMIKVAAAALAVVIVAVIGYNLLPAGSTGVGGPGPTASPAVTASPKTIPSAVATSTPTVAATPSPPAGVPSQVASAAGIVLQRAPDNLGCDSLPVDWRSATLHVDPGADIEVWAEADTGKRLAVYWSAGFYATDGDTPVIRRPNGEEVARDGTRIDADFYRLTGYNGCNGPDSLYVLDYVPG